MDEVLLFRLNLPKEKKRLNIELSLKNTVKILKAQEDDNYYILLENESGYKFEELSNDTTASFLIEKVGNLSKIISTHIWAPRDPDDREYSAKYYYPDKTNILKKISEFWRNRKKVYCIICDTSNRPYYIGRLIAFSPDAKNFLSKIFQSPDLGEFKTAFFFSKNEFYELATLYNYSQDLGYIDEILHEIEDLCQSEEFRYPLKSVIFSERKISELTTFLKSKNIIENYINELKGKKELAKNFLKGKLIETLIQIVFEKLLNYKIQATGYENWASVLKEDVIKKQSSGSLSLKVRKLPDFYFSYNEVTIPPIYYKGDFIKNGWLETKFRTVISESDLTDWRNRYESEVFLLIYEASSKKFYFIKVLDLPETLPIPDNYLFNQALLPIYSHEVISIMKDMVEQI